MNADGPHDKLVICEKVDACYPFAVTRAVALLIGALLFSACGCEDDGPQDRSIPFTEVQAFLWSADTLELLVVNPRGASASEYASSFHGYKALGSTPITEPSVRTRLLDALDASIRNNDRGGAKCMAPRHALRARKGKNVMDLLICFSCRNIWAYDSVSADMYDGISSAHPTSEARPVFDEVLADAGLTVPQ